MSGEHTPVLVGIGQLLQRDVDLQEALQPLAMLEAVARRAAEDSGAGDRLLRDLDCIALVPFFGWQTQNAPRLLAECLGARPASEYEGDAGGQVGVSLTAFIAERILRGESRIALIAGCNAMRTMARAHKQGVALDWTGGGRGRPEKLADDKPGTTQTEIDHGLELPPHIYPIFENALRARRGEDLETHRERMGQLFSPFTEVAAKNPYAWFPTYRSAEELITATPQNRMVAFPYTKYLNAVLETDQAAGLLMLSTEAARELGIPEERWIHWWGGAEAKEEAWWASERPDFANCPAMPDSTRGALDNAGISMDGVDLIDFYSCFPAPVAMACEMLGLEQDDPRGFTVTGGLPYGGGPASSYTLLSIATMAERLRERPGAKGLVTGNGWYLTKHAASVWSSEPKPGPPPHGQLQGEPASRGMTKAPAPVTPEAEGPGVVEAYTVLYARDGSPERGIVLGRLEDDRRFLANTPADRALLEDFASIEEVGRRGTLSHRDGRNLFDPA
ncbi:MAG: acetyl-CoA acetyltransferase [Deltaproteobacteria bacterium]|nr:acetyl-CoA acetyltransferase [Deltaproteobacteria bacterium]